MIIRQTENAITFTVPQGYDCSHYCGARGTLANANFPLTSKIEYTPKSKDELKCITGEGACKWQNDKKAKE